MTGGPGGDDGPGDGGPGDDGPGDGGPPDDGGGGDACSDDSDCGSGEFCGPTGECETDIFGGDGDGDGGGPECTTDADCGPDGACSDGTCEDSGGGDDGDTGGVTVVDSCDSSGGDASSILSTLTGHTSGPAIAFNTAAWWMNDEETAVFVLASESDDTCLAADDMSDGSYEGAAFLVRILEWEDVGSGSISFDDSSPVLIAESYELIGDSYVGAGLTSGSFSVDRIEAGETLEFGARMYDSDPSRSIDGSGASACYCAGLEAVAFPIFGAP
jgi:hypothetical protein